MKNLITLFFVIISVHVFAQQMPQFSQRMIDMIQFNPAYTGVKGNPEVVLHHRTQWLKWEGAPVTQSVSYNTMINRVQGIGIEVFKDEIGPAQTLDLRLTYAHHINFGPLKLALAVKGSYEQYSVDGKKITLKDPNDNSVSLTTKDKIWKPDASFGLFLYNNRFFFGFSSLQLLGTKYKLFIDNSKEGIVLLSKHHYLTGGFNFSSFSNVLFEPSILVTKADQSPYSFDFNLNSIIYERFLLGVTYRLNDAVVVLAGVKATKSIRIAYSYDFVTSPLRQHNSGSHEIILSFSLPDNRFKRDRWKHDYQYDFDPKTHKWRERW